MELEEYKGSFILKLSDGERFPDSILDKMEGIKRMYVIECALGMARDIEIGHYSKEKGYEKIVIKDEMEVLYLNGFFHPYTDPKFHIHGVFGDKEGNVKGGHLFGFTVCNVLEIILQVSPFSPKRKEDKNTGLKVFDL
jgi:predicted DNA-binding protein with PD1-like motif